MQYQIVFFIVQQQMLSDQYTNIEWLYLLGCRPNYDQCHRPCRSYQLIRPWEMEFAEILNWSFSKLIPTIDPLPISCKIALRSMPQNLMMTSGNNLLCGPVLTLFVAVWCL